MSFVDCVKLFKNSSPNVRCSTVSRLLFRSCSTVAFSISLGLNTGGSAAVTVASMVGTGVSPVGSMADTKVTVSSYFRKFGIVNRRVDVELVASCDDVDGRDVLRSGISIGRVFRIELRRQDAWRFDAVKCKEKTLSVMLEK